MSYGHSSQRDERRKSAIIRHERKAQAYKDLLKSTFEPADKKEIYTAKLAKTNTTLDNTQKNLGKGTSHLGKQVVASGSIE